MSLGERIKEQRKSSGLSQEKLAEFVGVSRQAVTKWETGQSAPSTENLFKLAEIFGTTVDILLASDEDEKNSPAEQIYYLYKMDQEKKVEERRMRLKKNVFFSLVVVAGYVIVYLAGRIFGTAGQQISVMGWLFGDDPAQLSYLYGWLLHQNIFWIAMAVSVIPALFGKSIFHLQHWQDLRLDCLSVNYGGKTPQEQHTVTVITVGQFGEVSLCFLLQWGLFLKNSLKANLTGHPKSYGFGRLVSSLGFYLLL